MSYIYKTTNGVAQKFNNETFAMTQSAEATASLEGFVAAGVLYRKDVLDTEYELGEDAYKHAEMTLNVTTGKLMIATNATQTPAGSLSNGDLKAGKPGNTVNEGKTINKSGNSAILANADIVIGAGGRVTTSQGTLVSLASAVLGLASSDLNQAPFATPARVFIDTNADDATARGTVVTLYVINELDAIVKEEVALNSTDSSTDVKSVTKVKKLLAYSVSNSITTATLRIKNADAAIAISQATPSSSVLYGSIVPDDSTDPLGQSVRILAVTAAPVVDSFIVVKGTDDNSVEQFEIIATDGATTTFKTTKQFKTITHLLVGADGVATNTYTISILANTGGEKIGTNAVAVAANTEFELTRA